jgi:hypothetical protein
LAKIVKKCKEGKKPLRFLKFSAAPLSFNKYSTRSIPDKRDGNCYIYIDSRWAILPCLLLADSLFSQIFQHTQTIGPFAQRVSILFRLSQQLSNNLLDYFQSTIFNPKQTGYHEAHHRPGEVKLDLTF